MQVGGRSDGRDGAHWRLLARLTEPSIGHPAGGVVLVVGTVGIGKTTFVERLRSAAEAAGVCCGSAGWVSELSAGPLEPWLHALEDLDDSRRRAGIATPIDRTEVASASLSPLARYREFARLLEGASAASPCLIVLEDLHDADSASVDLLKFLAQRAASGPWLVVATTRPSTDHLTGWRGDVVALEGLDCEAIASLATAAGVSLTDSQAEDLRRRTDGNPLFARRLIEHGVHRDQLTPSLSSLLRAEVADVRSDLQPLVDVASVLGVRSDRRLIEAVLDALGEQVPVLPATGSLIDGVLDIDQESVAFAHPLMRELMVDALGPRRRRQVHDKVAQVLQTSGADPLATIAHVRASLDGPPTAAAGALAARAADDALASGALIEAVDLAGFAAQAADIHGTDDEVVAAILGHVRALGWAGRIAEAELALQNIGTRPDGLSPALRRQFVRAYTRLRWREEPNASALNSQALVALSTQWLGTSPDAEDRTVHWCALVGAGEISGWEPNHLTIADEAVAAAQESGDALLRAEAHLARRRALIAEPSRLAERSHDSRVALELATGTGDDELIGRCQRLALCDALARGDRIAALSLIVRYDAAPTVGLREHTALREAGLASLEGRYDDAGAVLASAIAELGSLGVAAPTLEFFEIVVAFDRGGLTDALAEFEPIIAVVADPALRSAFAWEAASTGDHERAANLLDDVLDDLDAAESDHLWPVIIAVGGEAAAAIGHHRCAELLERIEAFEGQCLIPAAAAAPWFGAYDRIIGLLRFHLGDLDGACDALRRSIAIAERMHALPWVARGHFALAVVLRYAGALDDAATHETEWRRIAAQIGMGDVFLEPAPPASPSPSTSAAGSPASTRTVRFEAVDGGWLVGSDPSPSRLGALAGLAMIGHLVARPGSDWHVLDLYGGANQVPGVQQSDAGPMIDETARRAYQQRFATLSAERQQAEDDHDLARAELLAGELDALETELVAAFGLGGRSRRLDDPGERARVNVTRSIGRAIAAIESVDPWLGDHLRHRIRTGRFCRYDPDPHSPVTWLST